MQEELFNASPKLVREPGDPFFKDPLHRTPPSGVKKRRTPPSSVHKEHRRTVCHRYRHESPWKGGEMAIGRIPQGETSVFLRVKEEGPAMNLVGVSYSRKTQPDGETIPDFPRGRGSRLPEKGEITRAIFRHPSRGSLGQPGKTSFPLGVDPPEKGMGRGSSGSCVLRRASGKLCHRSD